MPELPEVETVARQLRACLLGRRVRRLRLLDPLLRNGRAPRLAGREITEVGRSGKRVLIGFSPQRSGDDPVWLAVHLRMTGRLLWTDDREAAPRAHLRARLSLDRGSLSFADTRRFGTLSWYETRKDAQPEGLEPLSPALTPARLAELMRDSRQNLKAWLLRQDRLVGLGNIYVSEILYSARLSPFREARSLDRSEVRRLHRATRGILERAIAACGTTFSDFQDSRGIEGSYQRFLAVYDRADLPCRRCREPIRRTVQQQRSTFHCAVCQGDSSGAVPVSSSDRRRDPR